MKKIYYKIYRIFVKWFGRKYSFRNCEDLPLEFEQFTVYLIGDAHEPWQAAFKCPCGCNSLIQLSLLKDARPKWRVELGKKNTISIYPSINRKIGCRSHFFLSRSKIDWAETYI